VIDAADCVSLASKERVWETEQPIHHVYFPETAVVSLVTLLDDGLIEAITIGNDGFVGLPVYHGPGSTNTRANCQMPGLAWRLTADEFRKLCEAMPELGYALDRYSQFVIETISQSAACNRVHVIEERCATMAADVARPRRERRDTADPGVSRANAWCAAAAASQLPSEFSRGRV
jgi:hypothetical protein